MVFLTNFFKKIRRYLRVHGFFDTFKLVLWELGLLGINTFFKLFRIKVTSSIEYPIPDFKVKVRFSNFFWKKLAAGLWEFNCIRYLSRIVRNGQIILDIGAWQGPYTLLLSKLIGNEGKVIAFEPDSSAYKHLIENIKINNFSNIITERMALSNFVGKSKLMIYRNIFGGRSQSISSLNLRTNESKFNYEVVNITTIDNYCEENNIHPNGIIIDVEGAEGLVIEGAQKVIERYSPWILLEFHGNLMTEEIRRDNLQKILSSSKKIAVIENNIQDYDMKQINDIKINGKTNLFIQY